jgi:hypothetical protein
MFKLAFRHPVAILSPSNGMAKAFFSSVVLKGLGGHPSSRLPGSRAARAARYDGVNTKYRAQICALKQC